jgi:hypothetical protein
MPLFLKFYIFNNRHDANRAKILLNESGLLTKKIGTISDWNPNRKLSENEFERANPFSADILLTLYQKIFNLLHSSFFYLIAYFKLFYFRYYVNKLVIFLVEGIFIIFSVFLFSQFLIKFSVLFLHHYSF